MNNEQNFIAKGFIKRIGITVACCLPALVLLGYWLRGLNNVATIAIFVLFMLVVVGVEEFISAKINYKKQVRKNLLHKNEDVFK